MDGNYYGHQSNSESSDTTLPGSNKLRIMHSGPVLAMIISITLLAGLSFAYIDKTLPVMDYTDTIPPVISVNLTDTTPPIITEVHVQNGNLTAQVTDDNGVASVTLIIDYVIAPDRGKQGEKRAFVWPTEGGRLSIPMHRNGHIYSASTGISYRANAQITHRRIEATDYNGNTARYP